MPTHEITIPCGSSFSTMFAPWCLSCFVLSCLEDYHYITLLLLIPPARMLKTSNIKIPKQLITLR